MNGDGNFKMKCVENYDNDYTKGKVYEVINGHWMTDDDISIGDYSIQTIDDANEFSSSKWELVEEETSKPIDSKSSVSERMRQVASMLDLELDEEFNINLNDGSLSNGSPYKFTEYNLVNNNSIPVNGKIGALLTGRYTVEKLPWKPKNGEKVWAIYSDVNKNSWCNYSSFQDYSSSCIALYKMGWLFRTKEEAEANKKRVLAEMKEVMKNE